MKLRTSIDLHCSGNPFTEKSPLKSLVSSTIVPEHAKDDIVQFAVKGQKCFKEFVQKRLLPSSKLSICDTTKKRELKTFSNCMEVGDKVIKLREERELLGTWQISCYLRKSTRAGSKT